ncbi:winged helix-turn-helix transcriptional regulator [Janthinobacterium sp. Mn2066]|uniref:winged helix-turn-helix transcriptional regulator n=1 Tax=Janthinobacterium sp. Mn2066 TaxID=3395264 RepID=UPI003BDD3BA1
MKPTQFSDMPCPIARSMGRVGDSWSMLILRDAFQGMTRFDEFVKSTGIAPNILTRRLNDLVDNGMLERRLYNEKPPRHEYLLTEMGRSFRPIMFALITWGNKHFSPDGIRMQLVNRETGAPAVPMLFDAETQQPLTEERYMVAPGPAASDTMRERLANAELRRRERLGITPPGP